MAYSPGFRPEVLGPVIRPIFRPNISSAYSSAILARLSARFWRVSRPWIVFALAMRALPSGEGPDDLPPCRAQQPFFIAGLRHLCPDLLLLHLQRLTKVLPQIVM